MRLTTVPEPDRVSIAGPMSVSMAFVHSHCHRHLVAGLFGHRKLYSLAKLCSFNLHHSGLDGLHTSCLNVDTADWYWGVDGVSWTKRFAGWAAYRVSSHITLHVDLQIRFLASHGIHKTHNDIPTVS